MLYYDSCLLNTM